MFQVPAVTVTDSREMLAYAVLGVIGDRQLRIPREIGDVLAVARGRVAEQDAVGGRG